MSGIYIHIPFCKQACHYCDFHFSTSLKNIDDLVDTMCLELHKKKDFNGINDKIETIYFGGGTPSILNKKQLEKILNTIHKNYTIDLKELSLEANPDDINKEKIKDWLSLGIERLSVGIQTFDSATLKFLNRCHNEEEAIRSVQLCKELGIENLNLDLIFGIPESDDNLFRHDLKKIIDLNPNHVSTYCLTIEEKTVFGKQHKKGILKSFPDENASSQYLEICETLISKGFDHYEISNFGKPGFYSKHNLSYWQNKTFIGVGPSAHSYDGKNRYINISSNAKYIYKISNDLDFFETEALGPENIYNEQILTKLRTMWGIDLEKIKNDFGQDQLNKLHKLATKWIISNDLVLEENKLVLTKKGKLFADSICGDLFI